MSHVGREVAASFSMRTAMADEIVYSPDLEELIRDLTPEQIADVVAPLVENAMYQSVLPLQEAVANRTPVGVTGEARAGVKQAVYGSTMDNIYGEVFMASSIVYGRPLEYGAKPHWPDKGALELWVRRKLGVPEDQVASVAYLIGRKISERGTRGAHMFRDGWNAAEGLIEDVWTRTLDDIAEAIAQ